MFRLEKLEIPGFKSFADKTTLVFGEGITGVVGPNGCGKSNVAEAISWVLGEQSAKTLRGGKMEDVIFNGTRDRKPQGIAEVLLTMVAISDIAARDGDADKEDEDEYDAVVSKAEQAASAARALVAATRKAEPGDDGAAQNESGSPPDASAAATTDAPTARLEVSSQDAALEPATEPANAEQEAAGHRQQQARAHGAETT